MSSAKEEAREPTRRGGKSWKRKMAREARIAAEQHANDGDSDAEKIVHSTIERRTRQTDDEVKAQLTKWTKGDLSEAPAKVKLYPKPKADWHPSLEASKRPSSEPWPPETKSKAKGAPAEQPAGLSWSSGSAAEKKIEVKSSSESETSEAATAPKAVDIPEEKTKALQQSLLKPKATPQVQASSSSSSSTALNTQWPQLPEPAPQQRVIENPVPATAPPAPLHLGHSDLHKVLDTDRGWINNAYAADFKKLWDQRIRVNICSYIGQGNRTLREDAADKVAAFNRSLAAMYPQFVGTLYLPVRLHVTDHRINSGGKASHLVKEQSCFIVDDAPDVNEECDKTLVIKSYRIFGGNKPWQRHETGKAVYTDFPQAVRDILRDFKAGNLPLTRQR